jgi:hypothetical protein
MSKEAVESILGKAILDAEFRKALIVEPEKALAGFDLTETEKAQLKGLESETLDLMSTTLDMRVSRSSFAFQAVDPTRTPAKLQNLLRGASGDPHVNS